MKKIDLKLFHQQLKHVRILKHVLKTIKNIEIQNKFLKNCEKKKHDYYFTQQIHCEIRWYFVHAEYRNQLTVHSNSVSQQSWESLTNQENWFLSRKWKHCKRFSWR